MKTTPRELEIVRAVPPSPLLRADDGADDRIATLFGHFSRFGHWYEVSSWWEGNFLERVAAGAFAKTFAERGDRIRCLFDHGYDPQIGNKILGVPEVLREDEIGPYYEVPLDDTSYNRDLLPGLRKGGYGASFRFQVLEESWAEEPGVSEHNPKGIPERTILVTRTFEFGPVTFPASDGASAAARALTDRYYESLRGVDPRRYEALRERVDQIRTSDGLPGQAAQREAAPAPSAPDSTVEHHATGLSPRERRQALHPFLATSGSRS